MINNYSNKELLLDERLQQYPLSAFNMHPSWLISENFLYNAYEIILSDRIEANWNTDKITQQNWLALWSLCEI